MQMESISPCLQIHSIWCSNLQLFLPFSIILLKSSWRPRWCVCFNQGGASFGTTSFGTQSIVRRAEFLYHRLKNCFREHRSYRAGSPLPHRSPDFWFLVSNHLLIDWAVSLFSIPIWSYGFKTPNEVASYYSKHNDLFQPQNIISIVYSPKIIRKPLSLWISGSFYNIFPSDKTIKCSKLIVNR